MVSFEEAKRIVLSKARLLGVELVPAGEGCIGRVLRENVLAKEDVPPFRRAAVDGYAVCSEDTKGATRENPVKLPVVSEEFPGRPSGKRLRRGEASLISTGAMVPEGADAIVMVEDTEREGKLVRIFREVGKGENVAPPGEDVKKGEVVLRKGRILDAPDIGMLVRVGKKRIKVSRVPLVGIVSTGDEVVEPGERKGKAQIYDANRFTLSSSLYKMGVPSFFAGKARDRKEEIRKCFKKAMRGDVVLFTGGVSMGETDLLREVLFEMGVKEVFWKIAIQPGKPVFFGITPQKKAIFGLPGNPVSAFITFYLLVRPFLFRMMGADFEENEIKASLEREVKGKKDRTVFLRGKIHYSDGKPHVEPFISQGSGILRSLTDSDCIIIVERDRILPGEEVKVIPFRKI